MFEILVYLFQNYYDFHTRPEPEALARKLTAAGFSEGEIQETFTWLAGFKEVPQRAAALHRSARSLRLYTEDEYTLLGSDGIDFLHCLERQGALDPALRELAIDRVHALSSEPPSESLPLARLKVIVLITLWSHDRDLDSLLVEELLSSGEDIPH
jgi:Smg protein